MGTEVKIDSDQLAVMRQAYNMLNQLHGDAKVGMSFKKLVKEKFPTASIPELDASIAVESGLKTLNERFEKFEQDRAKEKEASELATLQSRFDAIVKDRGYTEEGQKKILDLMKTRGIANPEDAAVIFEKSLPVVIQPKSHSSRMNFISGDKDDADFKKLMNDPEAFMVDEVYKAIAEKG